jgi:hypothetical protein
LRTLITTRTLMTAINTTVHNGPMRTLSEALNVVFSHLRSLFTPRR